MQPRPIAKPSAAYWKQRFFNNAKKSCLHQEKRSHRQCAHRPALARSDSNGTPLKPSDAFCLRSSVDTPGSTTWAVVGSGPFEDGADDLFTNAIAFGVLPRLDTRPVAFLRPGFSPTFPAGPRCRAGAATTWERRPGPQPPRKK